MKECSKCGKNKAPTCFSKGKAKDGLFCWCKQCQREYTQERRKDPKFRDRKRQLLHIHNQRAKRDVLSHYSKAEAPCCLCCGETTPAFLTIDHVEGGGIQHRKSLGSISSSCFYKWLRRSGYPEGFQVLCFNCNCGRSVNKGTCPHKEGDK